MSHKDDKATEVPGAVDNNKVSIFLFVVFTY